MYLIFNDSQGVDMFEYGVFDIDLFGVDEFCDELFDVGFDGGEFEFMGDGALDGGVLVGEGEV